MRQGRAPPGRPASRRRVTPTPIPVLTPARTRTAPSPGTAATPRPPPLASPHRQVPFLSQRRGTSRVPRIDRRETLLFGAKPVPAATPRSAVSLSRRTFGKVGLVGFAAAGTAARLAATARAD